MELLIDLKYHSLLTVRFPDLKENQVTIQSTTKLTFNISLSHTDVNKTWRVSLGVFSTSPRKI